MSARLLLLSCCAPCSVEVIERLHAQGVDFAVFFYNPNIRPAGEYRKRRAENKHICQELGIPFIEGDYLPQAWEDATAGLRDEPERGARCSRCFFMRLQAAARFAKENGFTRFSSVLGVSRFKDFNQVCAAAQAVAAQEDIPYDATNWRLNGGERRRAVLAREKRLYHQHYCGCRPRAG